MPVNDITLYRGLPLPHEDNKLKDDVLRLRQALTMGDLDLGTLIDAVANRSVVGHQHPISDVTNLQTTLDAKAADDHVHALNDLSDVDVSSSTSGQTLLKQGTGWVPAALQLGNVVGLEAALTARPTTTAMDAAILASKNSILNGAGPAFDTLIEFANALGNDPNFATTTATQLADRVTTTTHTNDLALKAAKAGDTFTGAVRVGSAAAVRLQPGSTNPGKMEFLDSAGTVVGSIGDLTGSRLRLVAAGTVTGFHVTGDVLASGDIQAFSDQRLKTNVKRIEHALETLLRGEGVMYDRDGRRQTGVIAQKFYTAIPELVTKPDNPADMWAVNYQQALGYIIESFRDVVGMIEDLQRQVEKKG